MDGLIAGVVWEGGELSLMEMATLWRSGAGWELQGNVVGALGGSGLAVRYRVACTPAWETRSVLVELTRPGEVRELTLEVRDGRWSVDGSARPDLDGLVDVDIQVTPATNTLPIARLALAVGERAEVTAAWIQLPGLEVTPLRQSYQRVGADRYDYSSGDFRASLTVGEDGLVDRYGSYWRRLPLGGDG